VVEIPGYTIYEKVKIAEDHIVQKQMDLNGLDSKLIEIPRETILELCSKYTKEAGVRELERLIGSVCRFYAARFAKDENVVTTGVTVIKPEDLHSIIGISRHDEEPRDRLERPGVAIGMAWTPVGGDILFVEATKMGGKGKLILTGKLGDVIKESAQAALSWIRTNAVKYGLATSPRVNILDETDIHIHFPAGATKKDGPSAGVTILSSIFSILVGKKVRSDTAMTGEITLRGLVLPVGGIKEKVLAAHRAGIKRVLLPHRNKKDLEEVPENVKQDLEIIFVRTAEKLIENIFLETDLAKPSTLSAL
jgi:ATP-dependent Lon protease